MNQDNIKLSIALLIALIGFPQISETIYTPALPSVASGLGASVHMVEATLSIYFLGFAIGVSLWGAISDWSGRRLAMLIGLFFYGIATVGCATVENISSLLAWRFVQAFGASVGSVITQTMLRDVYDGVKRAKMFAMIAGALAFSPAIGPVLGGFISELWGWRANFWALTVMGIILMVWSLFSLPETRPLKVIRPTIAQIKSTFGTMITSRTLWGHILLIGATNGIIFGFYQEAPFVFIEQWGMQPSHYGFLGLLIAAATVVAARLSYRFSQTLSSETIISCGTLNVILGGVIFTVIVLIGNVNESIFSLAVTIFALFVIFFGIGLVIPNSLSQALKPFQASAGTAGSIFGACYYILITGFTGMMSLLHNGTAFPLPLFIIALGIVLAIGSWIIRQAKFRLPTASESFVERN